MGRDVLGELLDAGYDRVLTNSYDLATRLNAEHAQDGRGAFGVVAEIATSWIGGLWELFGDGRALITPLQRLMVLREVLREQGLGSEPHLPAMLGRYLGYVCGLPDYATAIVGERPDSFTPIERRILDCLVIYRERLPKLGYIESGDAQLFVAEAIAKGEIPERAIGTRIAYLSDAPMVPDLAAFLTVSGLAASLSVLDAEGQPSSFERPEGKAFEKTAVQPAPEGLDVSFAFPSGTYAKPQLLVALVEEALRKGPVIISAKDPLALYESIAPGLAARGIRCAVKGSKPFAQTSLGAAYLALHDFLSADAASAQESQLMDVMALPLLQIGKPTLWQTDEELRGDRLIGRDRMVSEHFCAQIRHGSGTESEKLIERDIASLFYRVVSKPGKRALRALCRVIQGYNGSVGIGALGCSLEDWKEEQLTALGCIEDLYDVASALGVHKERMTGVFAELLRQSSVPASDATFQRGAGIAPEVLVLEQPIAVRPSCTRPATLIACDLDSGSYPAAERDDACSRLFYKRLGLVAGEDYLPRMRRIWNALVATPTRSFVALRCLNDVDGNPTYPCAMLEEFVDTYRDLSSEEALTGEDLDETYLLPKSLLGRTVTRGEDGLFHDVLAGVVAPSLEATGTGEGTPDRDWIAPRDKDGHILLSPTAVDAYRACPYNWFFGRRLETGGLDEELDALSLGTFYHGIFRNFYEDMRDAGMPKVTPSNLGDAHKTMKRVFQAAVKDQRKRHGDSRYVPKPGTTESKELDLIRNNLYEWVEFQSKFLRDEDVAGESYHFVPRAFELDLGKTIVDYAGARLLGKIDRVDVDADRGEAIVIDYKGAVGYKDYIGFKGDEKTLPRKKRLQGIIYAAVIQSVPRLRQELGLPTDADSQVVKAVIYSSYRPQSDLQGTFVGARGKGVPFPSLLLADKLTDKMVKNRSVDEKSYGRFFEVLETTVETEVVEPMARGEIPRTEGEACSSCPIVWCPERKSHGRF